MNVNYYNGIIQENYYNIKKSILSNIIGKQNDKSYFPDEFVIAGQLLTNKSNIAEFLMITFPKLD